MHMAAGASHFSKPNVRCGLRHDHTTRATTTLTLETRATMRAVRAGTTVRLAVDSDLLIQKVIPPRVS